MKKANNNRPNKEVDIMKEMKGISIFVTRNHQSVPTDFLGAPVYAIDGTGKIKVDGKVRVIGINEEGNGVILTDGNSNSDTVYFSKEGARKDAVTVRYMLLEPAKEGKEGEFYISGRTEDTYSSIGCFDLDASSVDKDEDYITAIIKKHKDNIQKGTAINLLINGHYTGKVYVISDNDKYEIHWLEFNLLEICMQELKKLIGDSKKKT